MARSRNMPLVEHPINPAAEVPDEDSIITVYVGAARVPKTITLQDLADVIGPLLDLGGGGD